MSGGVCICVIGYTHALEFAKYQIISSTYALKITFLGIDTNLLCAEVFMLRFIELNVFDRKRGIAY